MIKRYCGHCKAIIRFVDTDTKCPVCTRETMLETDKARVKRVRQVFLKLGSK